MNRRSIFSIVFLVGVFGIYFNYIIHYTKPRVAEIASVVRSLPKTEVSTEPKDNLVPVTRVIDGDTIVVQISGVEEKIRLIGVDTPEIVDPRKKVQCFGLEASNKMKEFLSGKEVLLKGDLSQDDKDKYGRLLRYIYLSDGTFVNQLMIEQGYAHEYTYRIPYKYQKEFKNAENSARVAGLGLWAPGVCEV